MKREIRICEWLDSNGWSEWHRVAITGDASARRYERLTRKSKAVILMDAPPQFCGSQSKFVQMAQHLRAIGLSAPEILDFDQETGLMILEDLGQTDFAQHLRQAPDDEEQLYKLALESLIVLQTAPPPRGLARMTPDVGAAMIEIAFEWAAVDSSADLATEITDILRSMLETVDPEPSYLSLRDFHAENLIWRAQKTGLDRVGLLDFQDAFLTHPTYDLASLMRDARRDADPALLEVLLPKLRPAEMDKDLFRNAFHVMAIQRNLRILGIFEKLAKQDGKTGYLRLLPRVWRHLKTDLKSPIGQNLAPLISRAFSQPAGFL